MARHRSKKPRDVEVSRRWSAIRDRERELADWLRGLGPRFMSDGDIDVHSVVCPCGDGRHNRALIAIDGHGRWVAHSDDHPLSIGLGITQLFERLK
jgi:hypothetical protein